MRAVTAAAVGAVALSVHTAFNARVMRVPPPSRPSSDFISVLVPARNEAHQIRACLTAVLSSVDVDMQLIVLDDASTDDTAAVVARIAERDERVRLLRGVPLPDGWLGKPHACQQLADAATGSVLIFLDADVIVAPDGLARTVALLHDARLDLVSPYPRQVTLTWGERVVQPLLQWSWLTFLPLRLAERLPCTRLVAANGQLLACRRPAYEAAGGHEAVCGEVIEDLALAAAVKRVGGSATVADGTTIASCRMYDGWQEVRDGYSKSLWAATRTPVGAAVMSGLLTWLYCLPAAAGLARLVRGRAPGAAAAVGYAAGVAGRVVAARATGGRPRDAIAHPVSIAALVGLLLRSHVHHRTGRLRWKGRPIPR